MCLEKIKKRVHIGKGAFYKKISFGSYIAENDLKFILYLYPHAIEM